MNGYFTPVVDVTDVPTVWERIVVAMLHSLWIGAAIGIVTLIAYVALRRAKAHEAPYTMLVASLVAIAMSPVLAFVALAPETSTQLFDPLAGKPPVEVPGRLVMTRPLNDPKVESLVAESSTTEPLRVVDEANTVYVVPESVTGKYAEAGVTPVVRESAWKSGHFVPSSKSIVLGYLAFAVLLLARLAIGIAGGAYLQRASQLVTDGALLGALARHAQSLRMRAAPAIAYCERVAVPTVVGVVRPMILLPLSAATGMTFEQVEYLVLHELAHIRRHDHIVNLVQRVIEALLFYHPVVWIVSRRIRIEREHCCDDMVVRLGGDAAHYADSLLAAATLARGMSMHSAVASLSATGNASHLRRRIARILGEPAPAVRLRHTGWAFAALCTFACVVAVGQLTLATIPASNRLDESNIRVEESGPVSDASPTVPVSEDIGVTALSDDPASIVAQAGDSPPQASAPKIPERIDASQVWTQLENVARNIEGVYQVKGGVSAKPRGKSVRLELYGSPGVKQEDIRDRLAELQATADKLTKEYKSINNSEIEVLLVFMPSLTGQPTSSKGNDIVDDAIGDLQDKDWWLRKLAVQQLADSGREDVWTQIVPLLKDQDERVQAAAASALGQLKNPASIKYLVAALKETTESGDPTLVVASAAQALTAFDEAQVLPLLRVASADEDASVRGGAAIALSRMDSRDATDLMIDISKMNVARPISDTRDNQIRTSTKRNIASGLGRGDRTYAIAQLDTLAKSDDPMIRREVCSILHQSGFDISGSPKSGGAESVLVADERVLPMLLRLAQDTKWEVRSQSIKALGAHVNTLDGNAPKAIAGLANALDDSDTHVVMQAGEVLAEIGWTPETEGQRVAMALARGDWDSAASFGAAAAPYFLRALEQLGPGDAILKSIGNVKDPAITDALIAALSKADDRTTGNIIRALGEIGGERAADAVAPYLADGRDYISNEAKNALIQMRDPRSLDTCIARLEGSKAGKHEMVAALGEIDDPKASQALLEFFWNNIGQDVRLRDEALAALARKSDPETGKELEKRIRAREFRDDHAIYASVTYLADHPTPSTADTLLALLTAPEGSSMSCKEAALKGLAKLKAANAVGPIADTFMIPDIDPGTAAKALVEIGTDEAFNALRGAYITEQSSLAHPQLIAKRSQILNALVQADNDAGRKLLIELFDGHMVAGTNDILLVAYYLAQYGNKNAEEALKQLRGTGDAVSTPSKDVAPEKKGGDRAGQ